MIDFSNIEANKLLIGKGLFNRQKSFYLNIDDNNSINPHILISGGSGSGKTTLLRKIINHLKEEKIIAIIDFHGDMEIAGENLIEFTPASNSFGLNPFELETDIKKGGVNIQAEAIASMLGTYFFDKRGISQKQKNLLEKLIIDTYKIKGIYQDDINSWYKEPPKMIDLFKLFLYIKNSNENFILNCINNIDDTIKIINKNKEFFLKHSNFNEIKDMLEKTLNIINSLENKEKTIDDNFKQFKQIDLNYYLDKTIYKSFENLYSYIEKIANLSIFNGNAPKLKKGVNRFNLSAFTSIGKPETAKFLGEFIAQKFFRATMLRGEYDKYPKKIPNTKCDRVLIFDESKLALPSGVEKENPYNIMNRIVTESRKYGLALILASQRLNHYSEEIISNINTKIILGIKPNDYKNASKVLGIKEDIINQTFSLMGKRTALIDNNSEVGSYEIVNFNN